MAIGGEMAQFLMLDATEQAETIRRMARQGWSLSTIAAATRLRVEQVRVIVGPPQPERATA